MADYDKLFEQALAEATPLSRAAQARRVAMRGDLSSALVSRRRRRVAVRAAGVLGVVLVAVLLFRNPSAEDRSRPSAAPQRSVVDCAIVRDDPEVLARYAVNVIPPAEVWIDDDALLALLASVNRRTGLIRTAGRVIVTGDAVDDFTE